MSILLLSLFGCFHKKKQPENLDTWIKTHFPGQLVVMENIVDLDPKNLFYKKKNTIVADAHDPEIQIRVSWFKGQEGLGIDPEDVRQKLELARKEVLKARTLFQSLQDGGLDSFAVGVLDLTAYILLYTEPSESFRRDVTPAILQALHSLPQGETRHVWVECMEPEVYKKECNDIVPFGYWQRGDSYHEQHMIMSVDFEYHPDLSADDLWPRWKINTRSKRTTRYAEAAYEGARSWAEKNIKGSVYVEGHSMYWEEADPDDPLSVHYSFPWFAEKPAPETSDMDSLIQGYIHVSYQTQEKTITQIRHKKEP